MFRQPIFRGVALAATILQVCQSATAEKSDSVVQDDQWIVIFGCKSVDRDRITEERSVPSFVIEATWGALLAQSTIEIESGGIVCVTNVSDFEDPEDGEVSAYIHDDEFTYTDISIDIDTGLPCLTGCKNVKAHSAGTLVTPARVPATLAQSTQYGDTEVYVTNVNYYNFNPTGGYAYIHNAGHEINRFTYAATIDNDREPPRLTGCEEVEAHSAGLLVAAAAKSAKLKKVRQEDKIVYVTNLSYFNRSGGCAYIHDERGLDKFRYTGTGALGRDRFLTGCSGVEQDYVDQLWITPAVSIDMYANTPLYPVKENTDDDTCSDRKYNSAPAFPRTYHLLICDLPQANPEPAHLEYREAPDGVVELAETTEYGTFSFPMTKKYFEMVNDSDGDGLPNWWEDKYELNRDDGAGDNGANGDPDEDGLTNIEEYQNGSDPWKTDTDDDGLWDNVEVSFGTNPNRADSDGDGLLDSYEVGYDEDLNNYDPYDPETNPSGTDLNANNPDTDGDGLSDRDEVREFTPGVPNPFDPLEYDSTGDYDRNDPDARDQPNGEPDGLDNYDGDMWNNLYEVTHGDNPMVPLVHAPATSWLGGAALCALVIALATIGHMRRKVRSAR